MSSGRSDAGKNCCGTNRTRKIAATNAAIVTPIVSHFARIAPRRNALYALQQLARLRVRASVLGGFRIAMPITGANTTATSHDTMSAMPTTAKIENVYSPAELSRETDGNEARRS